MDKNKIILSIVIVIIGISLFTGGMTWAQRNSAVRLENKIEAQYSANQSEYDNMWKKFKELTQVTEIQASQFKELYNDLISGRYTDTNLLFKSINESNPQLSEEVYSQLQREIAAGRNSFNNSQKKVIDLVREYNDMVETKILLIMLGKKPLNDKDYFITSDKTNDAFENKKDDEIKLN